jgi:GntR family histidine utilization transcriptional repressor
MTIQASSEPLPLYRRVKDHILERIRSGSLAPGARVPSENELVEALGVSRMTANRALRELSADGYLARVPGVGTFVKEAMARSSLIEIRNIAEEIASRGRRHTCRLINRGRALAKAGLAELFEAEGTVELFHILLVHEEDGTPVQLEDRYVNPAAAPAFLDQDFRVTTPTAYLVRSLPVDEFEHTVEAIMPGPEQRRLLDMEAGEPCLALHRRSWSRGLVATVASLVYPASRYSLYSRQPGEKR